MVDRRIIQDIFIYSFIYSFALLAFAKGPGEAYHISQ